MPDFDRAWELTIRDNLTGAPIFAFDQDSTLRMQFSITQAPGFFLSYGTIKVYNIDKDKLGALHYRSLINGIGKGPLYELSAGYSDDSSIFSAGAIHNSYSQISGTDYITTFEVGVEVGNLNRVLQPIPKENLTNPASIATSVKNILTIAVTVNGRSLVKISSRFVANCQLALAASKKVKLDFALTPKGSINNIINYLNSKLKIVIFRDARGAIDVKPLETDTNPFFDNTLIPLFYSTANDGFNRLVIGSPHDYISGVKFRAFINPGLKFFQRVNFKSKFIDRAISIQIIQTTGDTHSEEWYNDIDGINYKLGEGRTLPSPDFAFA